MALTFSLREFGSGFATRGRGEELRKALVARLAPESTVKIDFAGVTSISYSFADEFLGVLVASERGDGPTVELVNVDRRIDRVVRDAISRRRGEPVSC